MTHCHMPRHKKPTPESILTRQIREVLNHCGIFHWKVFQGLGCQPGVSDIVGLTKEGRFFTIEVKAAKNKLSYPQALFISNIQKSGGIAIVAYSVEDVIVGLSLEDRFLNFKNS